MHSTHTIQGDMFVSIDVAEEVFNRCCVGNETKDGKIGVDSKDYRLTFNYEFLEDFRDKKRSRYFSNLLKR